MRPDLSVFVIEEKKNFDLTLLSHSIVKVNYKDGGYFTLIEHFDHFAE